MMVLSMAKQKNPYYKKNKNLIIDETVFLKIAEDDMSAFEQLYNLTESSVYAFVLSILQKS